MGILKRLKRLWDISNLPPELTQEEVHEQIKQAFAVKKLATVVQDDPLDIFPSENPDDIKPKDKE